jgi:hypothetical protein
MNLAALTKMFNAVFEICCVYGSARATKKKGRRGLRRPMTM